MKQTIEVPTFTIWLDINDWRSDREIVIENQTVAPNIGDLVTWEHNDSIFVAVVTKRRFAYRRLPDGNVGLFIYLMAQPPVSETVASWEIDGDITDEPQPPAAESEPEPGKEEIDTDEPDADPPAGVCPVCGFVILDEPEPPADWRWWRCQACGYYGPRSEFVGNTDAPQPPAAGQGGG